MYPLFRARVYARGVERQRPLDDHFNAGARHKPHVVAPTEHGDRQSGGAANPATNKRALAAARAGRANNRTSARGAGCGPRFLALIALALDGPFLTLDFLMLGS